MAYNEAELDGQPGIYDSDNDTFYPKTQLLNAELDGKKGLYHKDSDTFLPVDFPAKTPWYKELWNKATTPRDPEVIAPGTPPPDAMGMTTDLDAPTTIEPPAASAAPEPVTAPEPPVDPNLWKKYGTIESPITSAPTERPGFTEPNAGEILHAIAPNTTEAIHNAIKTIAEDRGDKTWVLPQAAASLGTGLAAFPIAKGYQAFETLRQFLSGSPDPVGDAKKVGEFLASSMTYQPTDERARAISELALSPISGAFEAMDRGLSAVGIPQKYREAISEGIMMATGAKMAGAAGPVTEAWNVGKNATSRAAGAVGQKFAESVAPMVRLGETGLPTSYEDMARTLKSAGDRELFDQMVRERSVGERPGAPEPTITGSARPVVPGTMLALPEPYQGRAERAALAQQAGTAPEAPTTTPQPAVHGKETPIPTPAPKTLEPGKTEAFPGAGMSHDEIFALDPEHDIFGERKDVRVYRANHDPLTGLGNRDYLTRVANKATEDSDIISWDLDKFKAANTAFKYAGGDAILKAVGQAVSELGMKGNTYRRGGEEFVTLAPKGQGPAFASALTKKLESARIDMKDTETGENIWFEGIPFSHGIFTGKGWGGIENADIELGKDKAARKERGLRPGGPHQLSPLVRLSPEAERLSRTRRAVEEERDRERFLSEQGGGDAGSSAGNPPAREVKARSGSVILKLTPVEEEVAGDLASVLDTAAPGGADVGKAVRGEGGEVIGRIPSLLPEYLQQDPFLQGRTLSEASDLIKKALRGEAIPVKAAKWMRDMIEGHGRSKGADMEADVIPIRFLGEGDEFTTNGEREVVVSRNEDGTATVEDADGNTRQVSKNLLADKNSYRRAGARLDASFNPEAIDAANKPEVPFWEMTGGEYEAGAGKVAEIGPLYHGSPYKFDRFKNEAIGTGEGAQAFGYGHYLTDEEAIAQGYKKSAPIVMVNGKEVKSPSWSDLENPANATPEKYAAKAVWSGATGHEINSAIKELQRNTSEFKNREVAQQAIKLLEEGKVELAQDKPQNLKVDGHEIEWGKDNLDKMYGENSASGLLELYARQGYWNPKKVDIISRIKSDLEKTIANAKAMRYGATFSGDSAIDKMRLDKAQAALDFLNNHKVEIVPERKAGSLYTTTAFKGRKENLLEWDKPLDKQPAFIQSKLSDIAEKTGIADRLLSNRDKAVGSYLYGQLAVELGGQREASAFLKSMGIDGISYPAGSLSGVKDSKARNYVIFDPNDITIEGVADRQSQYGLAKEGKSRYTGTHEDLSATGRETAGRGEVGQPETGRVSEAGGTPSAGEFQLTPTEPASRKTKPTQQGLALGMSGKDLRAPERPNAPLTETPLEKSAREAREREAQPGLFAELEKAKKPFGVVGKPVTEVVSEQVGHYESNVTTINSAADVAHVVQDIARSPQEKLIMVMTGKDGRIISALHYSMGTHNASLVHPLAMGRALNTPGVTTVWFAHNHPSGDTAPSQEDLLLTKRLTQILGKTNVKYGGHIIIGSGRYMELPNSLPGGVASSGDISSVDTSKATHQIPIIERRYSKQSEGSAPRVYGATDVRNVVKEVPANAGVLLLDAKNRVLVTISAEGDISKLSDPFHSAIAQEAEKANAGSMILFSKGRQFGTEEVQSLSSFADLLGVRLLDAVDSHSSWLDSGRMTGLVRESNTPYTGIGNAELEKLTRNADPKNITAFGKVFEVSRRVYDGGKKSYSSFEHTMRMKLLGAWDKLKALVKRAWDRLVAINEKMGERGVTEARRKKETEKSLVTVHNISIGNVRHALKMGGIPVPSLAAIDVNKSNFHGFGEITLVAKKGTFAPEAGRENKWYGADAYSPRYPTVTHFITSNTADTIKGLLSDAHNEIKKKPTGDKDYQRYFGEYSWESDVEREGIAGALKRSELAEAAYLKEAGSLPKGLNNTYEGKEKVRRAVEKIGRDKFDAWVDDKVQSLGLTSNEKIFNGFTNSGRRRYLSHDLDTVVRLLKSQMKEGEGFNYGAGSVRSKITPQFRTLKKIAESRDKIVSPEEFDKLKDEANNELIALADHYKGYLQHPPSNDFGFPDTFSEHLKEAVETHNFRKTFDEYYDKGVDLKPAIDFVEKLRNMPTEYFEGKIQRAVGLGEFDTAIIPDNTPVDVRKALEKNGLKIVEYKKGDIADRKEKLKETAINNADMVYEPKAPYGKAEQPKRDISVWKKAVEQALAEGKPVPQRVIDDYVARGGKVPEKVAPKEPAKTVKAPSGEASTGTNVKTAAEQASSTLKDFIDRTPKAGLAIADMSKGKHVNDDIKMPGSDSLKSENETVEFRWQKSKGITQKGLLAKVKEHVADLWELRKPFPGLDYKEDAKVINALREFSAVPEYSKHTAAETTAGILAGMGPKKYDVFTRNIVLPDIIKDIESGVLSGKLPFGYKSLSEVRRDLEKFQSIAKANPDIQAALDRREAFHRALTEELVRQELLPKEVLDDPRYFHHQVLQYMEAKTAYPGTGSKDVRTHKKGFQKGRTGSSLDFNTEYVESEFEYVAQALAQLKTKEIVDRIGEASNIAARVRTTAAQQGLKDWRKAIPEGYTTWQPKPGTMWHKALSIPQRVIEEVLAGSRELNAEDVKEVIAMGQKLQEWVIPERVAKVLDNFRDFSKDDGFDRFVRSIMASWKQWVLLNPVRVLKYNINNMSGDLDIALAYDPRILKYFKQAAGEAWESKKGAALSRDMREAMEYGVVGSGFSIQEIPDVREIGLFKVLMGNDSNIISRYWEQTKEWTQWRENILRIAAYKYFKDKLSQGQNLYGVSRKSLVDAEPDMNRKAAMLARDLVGDYGNVSKAGQWLRERMIPFWSWMEINTPRYLRLIRNASYEGRSGGSSARVAGVMGKKAAFKIGKVILQANILYAAIAAWNAAMEKMMDLDDDEKRALYEDRRQQQLLLGRTDDGQVRTLRIQGALSDALDWMALGDWPDVMRDLQSGKTTVGEQAKEMAKAPINRLVGASHPIIKAGMEVMTGKQTYPDAFNTRPIRDRGEHVSRLFSLDMPYRYLTGKPTKGVQSDLLNLVAYTNDPGERSYWTARKMAYDYLEKSGKEIPSADPTNRSNALYYYKQAKRYKDQKAMEKFMEEYIKLGGLPKGFITSLRKSAPLGSLPLHEQGAFLASLKPDDKRQVELASKWFEKNMQISQDDIFNFKKAWNNVHSDMKVPE